MRSSTNKTAMTVTVWEQSAGEATRFTLVVRRFDGTVIRRPLLDALIEPPPTTTTVATPGMATFAFPAVVLDPHRPNG